MVPIRSARVPLLLLALALLPACAFDGYRYHYEPMFASMDAHGARLMVTVLGAKSGSAGALDTMHVRFRIESPAGTSARLLPESLKLLSADLRDFGPALVQPDSALEADGSAPAVGDVAFPYPDSDDVDIRGLSLSWTLVVAGEPAPGSASFMRTYTSYAPYSDPWYGSYYGPYSPWYGPWGPWYGPVHGPMSGPWHGSAAPAPHAEPAKPAVPH